jgi:DNA polymerase-1
MSQFFLIDGTALIYRAYFAFINNPLRNSKGENTSAIFGVVNSLVKLISSHSPERMIISFDLKEPTFRHEITDTYKANRPPAPPELISQVEPVKEFFSLLQIPEISIPGYEADDVLATLAEQYKDDHEVVIITGDKDFCQILDSKVTLFNPFTDKKIESSDVKQKYGVLPEQFVDYLAILGDSSDNIPGIRGIGAKGAAKLLGQFRSLDEIYNNLDKVASDSLRKKLSEEREAAYLSKKLAQIDRDVPIEKKAGLDFETLMRKATFNNEHFHNVTTFLKEYELTSIISKLQQLGILSAKINNEDPTANNLNHPSDQTPHNNKSQSKQAKGQDQDQEIEQLSFAFYHNEDREDLSQMIITEQAELNRFFDSIEPSAVIAAAVIPSERRGPVSGENTLTSELLGISLCPEQGKVYYLPLNHKNGNNLPWKMVKERLENLSPKTLLTGHDLKQDLLRLEDQGLSLTGKLFDTMIASYLLDSSLSRHSLVDCVKRDLKLDIDTSGELLGSGKNKTGWSEANQEKVAAVASEDANLIFKLRELYKKRLQESNLADLFFNIEMPLLPVLMKMERDGVHLECSLLEEINQELKKEINNLTNSIFRITGREFNINSTQQLSKILFEEMDISPVKKTKTGYSTDNYVLEVLAEKHEIARLLIDYRQLSKLRTTYVEALPNLIDEKTGRIHSSFNQTVTSTGRLSSSNPNLQNIPIRSKAGKQIRKAFTTDRNDYLILSADYSQIELRILGILSKDRNLITAFNHDQDIHAQTAGLILNKPITTIDQDERRMAKAINFGIIYGMGPNKLSRETNISSSKAKEFIEAYFTKFSRVKEYIEQQKNKAKRDGYAETIMGRKLIIPNIHSSNQRLRSEAERIAVNMPIQGSAADIIKIAMLGIAKEFSRVNNSEDRIIARMIIQVHDELVFEVYKPALEEIRELVIKEMKNALPEKYRIIIPLVVEAGFGINWFEAHS